MVNGQDISALNLPMDKAGEQYWTEFWHGKRLPPPIKLAGHGPRTWFYQEFHHFWRGHLPSVSSAPVRFLEIGCAQSRWLTYFAREWGYQVSGLDYSKLGCLQSRALLDREGLAGEIFHQDMFCPQPCQVAGFDLVFSNGVAEHFEDTGPRCARWRSICDPKVSCSPLCPTWRDGWVGSRERSVRQLWPPTAP